MLAISPSTPRLQAPEQLMSSPDGQHLEASLPAAGSRSPSTHRVQRQPSARQLAQSPSFVGTAVPPQRPAAERPAVLRPRLSGSSLGSFAGSGSAQGSAGGTPRKQAAAVSGLPLLMEDAGEGKPQRLLSAGSLGSARRATGSERKASVASAEATRSCFGELHCSLCIFPPDTQIPLYCVLRYWWELQGITPDHAKHTLSILSEDGRVTIIGNLHWEEAEDKDKPPQKEEKAGQQGRGGRRKQQPSGSPQMPEAADAKPAAVVAGANAVGFPIGPQASWQERARRGLAEKGGARWCHIQTRKKLEQLENEEKASRERRRQAADLMAAPDSGGAAARRRQRSSAAPPADASMSLSQSDGRDMLSRPSSASPEQRKLSSSPPAAALPGAGRTAPRAAGDGGGRNPAQDALLLQIEQMSSAGTRMTPERLQQLIGKRSTEYDIPWEPRRFELHGLHDGYKGEEQDASVWLLLTQEQLSEAYARLATDTALSSGARRRASRMRATQELVRPPRELRRCSAEEDDSQEGALAEREEELLAASLAPPEQRARRKARLRLLGPWRLQQPQGAPIADLLQWTLASVKERAAAAARESPLVPHEVYDPAAGARGAVIWRQSGGKPYGSVATTTEAAQERLHAALVDAWIGATAAPMAWHLGPDDGWYYQHVCEHMRAAQLAPPCTALFQLARLLVCRDVRAEDFGCTPPAARAAAAVGGPQKQERAPPVRLKGSRHRGSQRMTSLCVPGGGLARGSRSSMRGSARASQLLGRKSSSRGPSASPRPSATTGGEEDASPRTQHPSEAASPQSSDSSKGSSPDPSPMKGRGPRGSTLRRGKQKGSVPRQSAPSRRSTGSAGRRSTTSTGHGRPSEPAGGHGRESGQAVFSVGAAPGSCAVRRSPQTQNTHLLLERVAKHLMKSPLSTAIGGQDLEPVLLATALLEPTARGRAAAARVIKECRGSLHLRLLLTQLCAGCALCLRNRGAVPWYSGTWLAPALSDEQGRWRWRLQGSGPAADDSAAAELLALFPTDAGTGSAADTTPPETVCVLMELAEGHPTPTVRHEATRMLRGSCRGEMISDMLLDRLDFVGEIDPAEHGSLWRPASYGPPDAHAQGCVSGIAAAGALTVFSCFPPVPDLGPLIKQIEEAVHNMAAALDIGWSPPPPPGADPWYVPTDDRVGARQAGPCTDATPQAVYAQQRELVLEAGMALLQQAASREPQWELSAYCEIYDTAHERATGRAARIVAAALLRLWARGGDCGEEDEEVAGDLMHLCSDCVHPEDVTGLVAAVRALPVGVIGDRGGAAGLLRLALRHPAIPVRKEASERLQTGCPRRHHGWLLRALDTASRNIGNDPFTAQMLLRACAELGDRPPPGLLRLALDRARAGCEEALALLRRSPSAAVGRALAREESADTGWVLRALPPLGSGAGVAPLIEKLVTRESLRREEVRRHCRDGGRACALRVITAALPLAQDEAEVQCCLSALPPMHELGEPEFEAMFNVAVSASAAAPMVQKLLSDGVIDAAADARTPDERRREDAVRVPAVCDLVVRHIPHAAARAAQGDGGAAAALSRVAACAPPSCLAPLRRASPSSIEALLHLAWDGSATRRQAARDFFIRAGGEGASVMGSHLSSLLCQWNDARWERGEWAVPVGQGGDSSVRAAGCVPSARSEGQSPPQTICGSHHSLSPLGRMTTPAGTGLQHRSTRRSHALMQRISLSDAGSVDAQDPFGCRIHTHADQDTETVCTEGESARRSIAGSEGMQAQRRPENLHPGSVCRIAAALPEELAGMSTRGVCILTEYALEHPVEKLRAACRERLSSSQGAQALARLQHFLMPPLRGEGAALAAPAEGLPQLTAVLAATPRNLRAAQPPLLTHLLGLATDHHCGEIRAAAQLLLRDAVPLTPALRTLVADMLTTQLRSKDASAARAIACLTPAVLNGPLCVPLAELLQRGGEAAAAAAALLASAPPSLELGAAARQAALTALVAQCHAAAAPRLLCSGGAVDAADLAAARALRAVDALHLSQHMRTAELDRVLSVACMRPPSGQGALEAAERVLRAAGASASGRALAWLLLRHYGTPPQGSPRRGCRPLTGPAEMVARALPRLPSWEEVDAATQIPVAVESLAAPAGTPTAAPAKRPSASAVPAPQGHRGSRSPPHSPDQLRAPGSPDQLRAPGSPDQLRAPGSPDQLRAPGSPDQLRAPGSPDQLRAPGSKRRSHQAGSPPQAASPTPQPVSAVESSAMLAAGDTPRSAARPPPDSPGKVCREASGRITQPVASGLPAPSPLSGAQRSPTGDPVSPATNATAQHAPPPPQQQPRLKRPKTVLVQQPWPPPQLAPPFSDGWDLNTGCEAKGDGLRKLYEQFFSEVVQAVLSEDPPGWSVQLARRSPLLWHTAAELLRSALPAAQAAAVALYDDATIAADRVDEVRHELTVRSAEVVRACTALASLAALESCGGTALGDAVCALAAHRPQRGASEGEAAAIFYVPAAKAARELLLRGPAAGSARGAASA
eukprot:TRINITY_DN1564_c0_g1_i2.p1 TRINITY_DN1564_c0_g1~~TRINITY_DN1564_c0_g1_i2.p1  ORF type:complete len:2559 (+),score=569.97 TRINITY_DN1564_c0_g1_i2:179-7678(+)